MIIEVSKETYSLIARAARDGYFHDNGEHTESGVLIRIDDDVHDYLEHVREQRGLDSVDEVINQLLTEKLKNLTYGE